MESFFHSSLHLEYVFFSYASYNYSAPRLPKGLAFSSTLRAITNQAYDADGVYTTIVNGVAINSYWNLGNALYTGLSCPYLLLASSVDEASHFLAWYLDPEYTLFEGCRCAAVSGTLSAVYQAVDPGSGYGYATSH